MDKSENRILEGRPVLTSSHFVYSMPKWAAQGLGTFAAVFGAGAVYLALTQLTSLPLPIRGFIGIIAAFFISSAMKSKTSKEYVSFICDREGLYLPSYELLMLRQGRNANKWVFVPWVNIKNLKLADFASGSGRSRGFILSARLSDEEAAIVVEPIYRNGMQLRNRKDAEGNWIFGFSSPFQKREDAFARMNAYRSGKSDA